VDYGVPPGRPCSLDVGGDVVEERHLVRLHAEPAFGERVDGRVGLLHPHLVGVDDVVGDLGEAPARLPLPGTRARVAEDAGQLRGSSGREPVEERLVEHADVPAPEVVHQLVDRRVAQFEGPLPMGADLGLGHLADDGIAREPVESQQELVDPQPEARRPGAWEDCVVDDLEDAPDVEHHRPDRHSAMVPQPSRRPFLPC
jgi:hypothetical protein